MRRFMITAMSSDSGKTVMTCALMRAYQRRGLAVAGFKSGPDYIDPMFHTRVLGVPSRNLDLFLQGKEGVLRTLAQGKGDLAIVEGAMGFYDGKGGTTQASAWETADVTKTPAVLVLRPKGQSMSLAAQVRGMTAFRSPGRIAALLLTDCRDSLYAHLAPVLEKETGLPVLGYLPPMEEADLPSRHLGLVTADEIEDLNLRFDRIAQELEKHADLDRLLALAADEETGAGPEAAPKKELRCRIAVAKDEAFSFYYEENLDRLRACGARIVPFSPLRDPQLPEADGLYLGGGYPELYLKQLSENGSMRESVRRAVEDGMPAVAACGGFLYLQKTLNDAQGKEWPMAGVLGGTGFPTDRLQRFGYLTLTARENSLLFEKGEQIPAHEFHYWDSTDCGQDLEAAKDSGRKWRCAFAGETLYAAFPHLHFGGVHPMAERFVQAAEVYAKKREEKP